uniref:Uncharacterized protein n=1 Tax=Knipowitschia caucasica TaxID=637954 RepID=A0AAV2KTI4_KNICA
MGEGMFTPGTNMHQEIKPQLQDCLLCPLGPGAEDAAEEREMGVLLELSGLSWDCGDCRPAAEPCVEQLKPVGDTGTLHTRRSGFEGWAKG